MCIKESLMRIQSSQVMKNHNQIMDYITEMIVSFDFFGELLYANPPFMKTLGYDETEDREINLWSLLKEEDKKLWDRFFLFAKEGKEIENKEVTLVSKEGNPLSMMGVFHLLRNEEEGYFGCTVFLKLKPVMDTCVHYSVNELLPCHKNISGDNEIAIVEESLFKALNNQISPINRFLDSLNDLVFFKDIHGVYRGCNQAFSNLLDVPKNKIIGKNDFELYPDDIAKIFRSMDEGIRQDLFPRKMEEWVMGSDGNQTYVETLKTLYLDEKGVPMGYLGVSRDFTERKKTERQIAENELWLNLYFEQSVSGKIFMMLPEPIFLDSNAPITKAKVKELLDAIQVKRVNKAMKNLYAGTDEDFLGKENNLFWISDPDQRIDKLTLLLKQGYLHHLSLKKKLSGEEMWISGDYTSLYNDKGMLYGFYGNQDDVTKEIEINEKSVAMEKYLRTIIETTRDGYYAMDLNYRFIDVNEAYCEMSGYTREEILGMSIKDVMAPEVRNRFEDQEKKIVDTGASLFESRYMRRDGSIFDVEVSVANIGCPREFLIAFIRDITERKQLESFYLIEKELFKNTLLSAGDAVISTDTEGNILLLNSMAESLTKWTQDEARGKSLNEIMTLVNNNGEKVLELASEAMTTEKTLTLSEDVQLLNRHGDCFFIELSASPIVSNGKAPRGVVVIFKDTTNRRKTMKIFEDLSYKDALTNLYNRRYLDESLKNIALDSDLPLTIMVMDVNSLKLTNDAFGHAMGDQMLKTVARICEEVTRQGDVVCRSGGDEFVIMFPNTDRVQAKAIKDRIISKVSKSHIASMSLSLAIGFSVMKTKDEHFETVFSEADYNMYQNKVKYGKEMKLKLVDRLLQKLNQKYSESLNHNKMVSKYSYEFAKALHMDENTCEDLKKAGLLHDIGKVMISPQAIKESEVLSMDKVSNEIKKHAEIGYQILKEVREYANLADSILYHHECYDGTGFPRGLKGDDIPLESRMLAIANTYEILTGNRSYRDTMTKEKAIFELRKQKGTQFDPALVEVFINGVANNDEI